MLQNVRVSVALHVQDRPDPQHEVLRFGEAPGIDVGLVRRAVLHPKQQPYGGRVAQSAGRVLDVRLQVKHGVIEAGEPLLHQIDQGGPHRRTPGRFARQAVVGHPLEQRAIPLEEARLHQGRQVLGVVDLGIREFGEATDLVTHFEPEVPKRMEDRTDEFLFRCADLTVEDYQQVDVRMQAEVSAAVPADGNQGARRAGDALGSAINAAQDVVDARGITVEAVDAGACLPGPCLQLLACGVELRPPCRPEGDSAGVSRRSVVGGEHRGLDQRKVDRLAACCQ